MTVIGWSIQHHVIKKENVVAISDSSRRRGEIVQVLKISIDAFQLPKMVVKIDDIEAMPTGNYGGSNRFAVLGLLLPPAKHGTE